jgi:Fe-S-cluster-containing hydrogenase component 2
MQGYYGFKDGSGEWFLIVDTEKCNGCRKCVEVCPMHILDVSEDEFDPFRDEPVVKVKNDERNKIRYSCAPCKPGFGEKSTPCMAVCEPGAISFSDAWKQLYDQQ